MIERFFYTPASPAPLRALRVAVTSLLLLQAALLTTEAERFFGRNGLIATSLTDLFIQDTQMPRIYEVTDWLSAHAGLSERAGIALLGGIYVAALLFLLAGRLTRAAAAVACLLHVTFITTGYYSAYGVDRFAQICLFYFVFMPVTAREPSSAARLSLRVLQLHLCVAYVASGVEKLVGIQWRSGEAVFRAVMLPSFAQFDLLWLAWYPPLGKLLCWGTLLLEIGYGVFIWPRATRKAWVLGIESLHLGIALFMGLYFFAAMMGTLTYCCFWLPTEEPSTWGARSGSR